MILRTFTRGLFRNDRALKYAKTVDYAVCIDIECTCDSPIQIYPMELIQIACLKVDLTKRHPQANPETNPETTTWPQKLTRNYPKDHMSNYPAFNTYVKPIVNPELTLFCQDLTGILQSDVDNADTADVVLQRLMRWLSEENLINENHEKIAEFAFASCGNFDLNFLSSQFNDTSRSNSNPELPIYFREWINVKKLFVNHKREWPKNLYQMMEKLGEEPSGRLHSAEDDCKNLARVVECLHLDGCKVYVTNRLSNSGWRKNGGKQ